MGRVIAPRRCLASIAQQSSGPAFHEGIRDGPVDDAAVRIYDPEKTIANCFKFRNRVGLDIAIEALRLWRKRRGESMDCLLRYARLDRVERVIRPYLEALA